MRYWLVGVGGGKCSRLSKQSRDFRNFSPAKNLAVQLILWHPHRCARHQAVQSNVTGKCTLQGSGNHVRGLSRMPEELRLMWIWIEGSAV